VAIDRRSSSLIEIPDYCVVGYVRDGRFAALAAVLAVLHMNGLVVSGRSGTLRRDESVNTAPTNDVERTVWLAIHGFVSPGALTTRPSLDSLFTELRRRCHRLGLVHALLPVRTFTPSRTPAGRELLDSALRDCPWPPSPEGPADLETRVGMPVALYGTAALKVLMPHFAKDSGLLSRETEDGIDLWSPPGSNSVGPYA